MKGGGRIGIELSETALISVRLSSLASIHILRRRGYADQRIHIVYPGSLITIPSVGRVSPSPIS